MIEKLSVVLFVDGDIGSRAARIAAKHDLSLIAGFVTLAGRSLDLPTGPPCIQFRHEDLEETAERIRDLGGDVFILAWWPTILKARMLNLGQRATLNFHPSLLPHCRGKDPNFWSLVEGRPFGVTIHHVTTGIDTGDIAFQSEIPYDWTDTGKTLYERASGEMLSLFEESYPAIVAGDIPRRKQDLAAGSFHLREQLAPVGRIALDRFYTARELLNLLRARTFEPWPSCQFCDGGRTFEVRVSITEKG